MENIVKEFPGVKALDNAYFELKMGEVHGMVGENGAGKSTLIKILSGAVIKDSGKIILNDKEVNISTPLDAIRLGIATIYQELNLIPNLTVAQNIFLGREPLKLGFDIDRKKLIEKTVEVLERMGVNIRPSALIKDLSVAQQQLVEIAKAISLKSEIIIMDEPTSALNRDEIDTLFNIINKLKSQHAAIIFISHTLDEIIEITDRITILRDGKIIGNLVTEDTNKSEIINLMLGHKLREEKPDRRESFDSVIMEINDFSTRNKLNGISFKLYKSEILGLAGLLGSGRTELLKAIFGAEPISKGSIFIENKELKIKIPQDALSNGIGLLTEDRRYEGLLLEMSVMDNITISIIDKIKRFFFFLDRKKQQSTTLAFINKLLIKTPNMMQKTMNLSGGNQQKVVLAKWLSISPKVLMLDEPTRGIDVGAKDEIRQIIKDLSKTGLSIILVSSELPDITSFCDRVLIIHEGTITNELKGNEINEENIIKYISLGQEGSHAIATAKSK